MDKDEKTNYVHCVFQELEVLGTSLPIGDYDLMYSYLEEIRDYITLNDDVLKEIVFLAHRAKAIDVDRRELLQLLKRISKLASGEII